MSPYCFPPQMWLSPFSCERKLKLFFYLLVSLPDQNFESFTVSHLHKLYFLCWTNTHSHMRSESFQACLCNWNSACWHSANTRPHLYKIFHRLWACIPHDKSSGSCHLYYGTCDRKCQRLGTHLCLHNLFRSNRGTSRQRCNRSCRCNSVRHTSFGSLSCKYSCNSQGYWYNPGNIPRCLANIRQHPCNFYHPGKVDNLGNMNTCIHLENCCTAVGSHADWSDTRLCPHKTSGLLVVHSHGNTSSCTFQECSRTIADIETGRCCIRLCPRTSFHQSLNENRVHKSIWNFQERLNTRTDSLHCLTSTH